MTGAQQIIVLSLAGGALVYVVIGKLQRMRLENHPDVRRMRAALEQVRLHKLQRADTEAGRIFDEPQAQLDPDLRHAVDQPKKLLVLCQGSRLTGAIGSDDKADSAAAGSTTRGEVPQAPPPERTCAIFIVCRDDVHYQFAAAKDLERTALIARELGRLLGVPVEMV